MLLFIECFFGSIFPLFSAGFGLAEFGFVEERCYIYFDLVTYK